MPKVILEFNLPEEQDEYEITRSAGKMYSSLWDIQNYMRELRKYDEREEIPKDEIIEKIYSLMCDMPDVS